MTVTVIATIALPSLTLGQGAYEHALEEWINVHPGIGSMVASQRCSTPINPDSELVRMKIGVPYEFTDYNLPAKFSWAIDVFWDPNRAVARRTFEVLSVSDLTTELWAELSDEFGRTPSKTAIMVPTISGYVGAPVKWTTEFATAGAHALEVAARVNDPDNAIVSAMWAEVLELSNKAYAELGYLRSDAANASRIQGLEFAASAVQAYDCGNVATIRSSVTRPVFIGFSELPTDFELQPIQTVITQGGAGGQPLGSVMPSWPKRD